MLPISPSLSPWLTHGQGPGTPFSACSAYPVGYVKKILTCHIVVLLLSWSKPLLAIFRVGGLTPSVDRPFNPRPWGTGNTPKGFLFQNKSAEGVPSVIA